MGFIRVFLEIVNIDDEIDLREWRYTLSLEYVLRLFVAKDRSRPACERMLRLFEAYCARTPPYREKFGRIRKELADILKPLDLRMTADQ